ncbi:hypothetical protein AND_003499 [Anopheles darlingi]|uniref:GH18 domain-containing protein n=1 Tax=Anopheles darlingi TaxID=43151 RepID=W5JK44_ANODA|nr:hypothetical protein AND_003499 [Anopheles darlingi]
MVTVAGDIAGRRRVSVAAVALVVLSLLLSATGVQSGKASGLVCIGTMGNFTANTAIGFCTSAVYIAAKPGANGDVAYVNANSATLLSGLTSFCSRKQAYPYVDLYVGVRAAGTDTNVATMLSDATVRVSFITKLIQFVKTYTGCSGIYIDLIGLTAAQSANYGLFMDKLLTDATAATVKVASALPWNAVKSVDIYYNPTLPKLAFNLLLTYEQTYTTIPTTVRPIAQLFTMDAPLDQIDQTIFSNLFRWVIKGLNPKVIILGLPMYSQKYTVSGATGFGALGSTAPVADTYCNLLPLLQELLRLHQELLPLRQELLRLHLELLPLRQELLPLRQELLPLLQELLPLHQELLPLLQERLPLLQELLPLRQELLPLHQELLPLHLELLPLLQERLPLHQELLPQPQPQQRLQRLCEQLCHTAICIDEQRVCLARIADYGTATAFGFCNQAVYLALRLNTNAAITYVNTAMTSAAVEAGIRTYAGYKTTYPQVDFYLGVDSLPGSYETWITNARATAISAITAQLRTYPTVAGVYIDIVNVPANRGYNNVFRWVLSGIPTLKLALGLPMYGLRFTAASATALGATSTVVNPDTYCNALIFGVTNTAGAAQAGEGFAYSSSAMMVYNTFNSVIDKLNFASATNLFGVGLYSMDQAGSTNAELLRYVTSVLAPVPPAGVVYPAAEPATCQVPITFPVPPTTTTTPTTTTPTTTTPTTTTPTTTTPTTTTPTTTTPTTTTPTTTTPTTTTPTTTTPTTTTPTTTTYDYDNDRSEYGNLVSQYCSGIQNVTAFVVLGGTCGTAS